jgi:hypothetical protein
VVGGVNLVGQRWDAVLAEQNGASNLPDSSKPFSTV